MDEVCLEFGVLGFFCYFFLRGGVLTFQNKHLISHYIYLNKNHHHNTAKPFSRLGLTPTFKNRVIEKPGFEELPKPNIFFVLGINGFLPY